MEGRSEKKRLHSNSSIAKGLCAGDGIFYLGKTFQRRQAATGDGEEMAERAMKEKFVNKILTFFRRIPYARERGRFGVVEKESSRACCVPLTRAFAKKIITSHSLTHTHNTPQGKLEFSLLRFRNSHFSLIFLLKVMPKL